MPSTTITTKRSSTDTKLSIQYKPKPAMLERKYITRELSTWQRVMPNKMPGYSCKYPVAQPTSNKTMAYTNDKSPLVNKKAGKYLGNKWGCWAM